MATFGVQLFFPADDPVACAEILHGGKVVASVSERPEGWRIDLYQSPSGLDLDGLFGAIASARATLGGYPNRSGESPPEGLSAAGLSLWLSERADGTTLADRGVQRPDAEPLVTSPPRPSPAAPGSIRSATRATRSIGPMVRWSAAPTTHCDRRS